MGLCDKGTSCNDAEYDVMNVVRVLCGMLFYYGFTCYVSLLFIILFTDLLDLIDLCTE